MYNINKSTNLINDILSCLNRYDVLIDIADFL